MVAGHRSSSSSRHSKHGLVELSDTDAFTVAPFVDKFCLEFQKFNQEASQHIIDNAFSFNGKAIVDNLFRGINKFHQDASRHASAAAYNSKAVVDKLQADFVYLNHEASQRTQRHGKAVVDKVQVEFARIQSQASKMASSLSTIMSNNACLALHPSSQEPAFEMEVDDSRDPTETVTSERNGADGKLEPVQDPIEAEMERIKVQVTTITLTTEAATKIYATKSFLDGDYAENPNLWKVNFDREWIEPLPLTELERMEIHIGGNFFARISHENSEGFVEDNKPGEIALCIDDLVWVTLSLCGYKARQMEKLKSLPSNTVLCALLDLISTSIRFRVEDIQFISANIPGLMSFVHMDKEREQERQQELKAHELLGEIILIMQRNGGGDNMKELVARGSEILDALLEASSENAVDNDRLDKIVPLMMAAQNVGVQALAEASS